MTIIFYILFVFVAVIEEISSLSNPGRVFEMKRKVKEYVAKKDSKSRSFPDGVGWQLTYLCLNIIGLFTSQWPFFLLLIILGIIIPKRWKAIIVLDAVLSLIVVLAIAINKFHIHYDLTAYIISLFK